jgi:tetratricopeptide (TPR) repeat protein
MKYGALAVLAFLFSTAALAVVSEQEVVHRLYQRGLAGDKHAVDECIAKLEDRLKAEPENQLARIYLGSAYTLRSRDLGFGPAKLTTLRHGLALMDEAVAAAPNDLHVRLLRALTTLALPSFLSRRKSAQGDFEALLAMLSKDPDKLSAADQQTIYYNAGVAAQKSGNAARARELWKDAAKHPIDPALAEKVNAALVGK